MRPSRHATRRVFTSVAFTSVAFVSVAFGALAPFVLGAQENAKKSRGFSTDFGFVSTAGNSRVTTVNIEQALALRSPRWEHRQKFGILYGSTDGKQSSNMVFANWHTNLALNPWLSVSALAGFDRNQFAGIASRFEQAAGLSAKLMSSAADHLDFELGLARNQQRSTDGKSLNFTSVRSSTTYKRELSKNAQIQQSAEFLPSFDLPEDYRINSESAVVAPLSRHVAVKLGYVVRFDNLPETGRQKSDRVFNSGLRFTF